MRICDRTSLNSPRRLVAAVSSGALLSLAPWSVSAEPVDCADWNTEEFFEQAQSKQVRACLAAGADPLARNYEDAIPWFYAKENKDLKGTEPWRRLRDASE